MAPVDAAFHALPGGVMIKLREDMPFLREILLYHIIPQKIPSVDLQNDNLLTTLQGQDIRCNIYGPVRINNEWKIYHTFPDSRY